MRRLAERRSCSSSRDRNSLAKSVLWVLPAISGPRTDLTDWRLSGLAFHFVLLCNVATSTAISMQDISKKKSVTKDALAEVLMSHIPASRDISSFFTKEPEPSEPSESH